jgi:DNA-binding CsgD family transcriptional regulator
MPSGCHGRCPSGPSSNRRRLVMEKFVPDQAGMRQGQQRGASSGGDPSMSLNGGGLVGRSEECALIVGLFDAARRGDSSVLVLYGDPGIGKSSLLDFASASAAGMVVCAGRGIESEVDLAYGQLGQLLRPLRTHLEALPPDQSRLLEAVFGFGVADTSMKDRYSVSIAVLGLLTEAAASSPVLLALDDVQWVDAQTIDTLSFVARRLLAEGIVILLASREIDVASNFDEADTFHIDGLSANDAAKLLARRGVRELPPDRSEYLVRMTEGNPLALIDLPRYLEAAELRGEHPDVEPMPIGERLTSAYEWGIFSLPAQCRRALLVASIIDDGDVPTLASALSGDGLTVSDLEAAVDAGFVSVGSDGIKFRHPLLRSAVVRTSLPWERRHVHRLVGASILGLGNEDRSRKAWHLAAGTVMADPVVAELMEEEGHRAIQVAGFASGAHAYERAAQLSTNASDRCRRFFAAANAANLAGRLSRALALVDLAMGPGAGDEIRLGALRLRCRIEALLGQCEHAIGSLLAAADAIEDPTRSAQVMLDTLFPFAMIGDADRLLSVARRAARLVEGSQNATELVATTVIGIAHIIKGESAEGLPLIDHDDLVVGLAQTAPDLLIVVALVAHCRIAVEMFSEADRLFGAIEAFARSRDALSIIPTVLFGRAMLDYFRGNWHQALVAAQQGVDLSRDGETSTYLPREAAVLARVAAGLGDSDTCEHYGNACIEMAIATGEGMMEAQCYAAFGVLELGRGGWMAAVLNLEKARSIFERQGSLEIGYYQWAPELVEAYVHSGRVTEAQVVVDLVRWHAERTERPIIWAFAERCRGLLGGDREFEGAFCEALHWHEQSERPFEEARTRLCFGERLRRVKRKAAAREQLQMALSTFTRLGSKGFAQRSHQELASTGMKLVPALGNPTDLLTPRELQVALILSNGATIKEAASLLVVSPKTIEYHLRHVYQKFGVSSRVDLRRAVIVRGGLE